VENATQKNNYGNYKMADILGTISTIFLILIMIGMGFVLGVGYSNDFIKTPPLTYKGLSFRNYNCSDVQLKAYEYEPKADWVCINVDGMSYEKMINTCVHEASHEIFAEYCADNIKECFDVAKIIGEEDGIN